MVPVLFTDSELIECQHGVRLAWVLDKVYEFGIFLRPLGERLRQRAGFPSLNFADIRECVQAVSWQLLTDQEKFFLDLTGRAGADVSF